MPFFSAQLETAKFARPVRVGLLPPVHPDVLRRGHGGGQEVFRAAHRPDEGAQGRSVRRGAHRRGPEGAGRPVQGRVQGQAGRGDRKSVV